MCSCLMMLAHVEKSLSFILIYGSCLFIKLDTLQFFADNVVLCCVLLLLLEAMLLASFRCKS